MVAQIQPLTLSDRTPLKERSEEKYYRSIIKDIEWLKISPSAIERQSSKTEKYIEIRDYLIKEGHLYPCYETDEELNRLRKVSLSSGLPPIYDRASLKLTKDEIKDYEANGIKPYWRFKLDRKNITWNDLIRGEQSIACDSFSDPVLIRADGTFLYTLPSVVDDIDMGITHLIRGDDHLSNLPVQVNLFKSFQADVPSFCHLPMIHGIDGKRLSKRHAATSLEEYKDMGYLDSAILNSLARLGWSGGDKEVFYMDDLLKDFNIKDVQKAGAIFDITKLDWLNAQHLANLSLEEFKEHKNPTIQRFMGELNGKEDAYLGSKMELYREWAAEIIRYIGNYEEIYERNLGENTPLRLKRGLNKLYTEGGLFYSPPLK